MHFREPLISEKPKFLALIWVYGSWCCQVAILSAYNASVMFLLHSDQSIMLSAVNNPSRSGQAGLFDQRYLKKEYTCTILTFFHPDRHGNKETSRKSFDVKCEKITKKWEEPSFKKLYYWFLITFDFWILWLSILKDLLA